MRYRYADVKGRAYFFTVNLAERQNTLLLDKIDKIRNLMNKVKKHSFRL